MEGKKSVNCCTRQNRLDVRLAKARRSMAYAIGNCPEEVSYFASLIARLEAMIAANGGAA
jgi:flagellar biosynthesis/type III secretory pathway ATPase